MMGAHHAVTGAAAWVALTAVSPSIPGLALYPLEPAAVAIGAVVCAGAALLPDADHHNATIAHSVPIAGKLATAAIGSMSGGHRHGTHSGVSAVIVFVLAFLFTHFNWADTTPMSAYVLGAGIAAAALLAFAIKVLKIVRSWGVAWLSGIVMSALITFLLPSMWAWLPMAVAVGWVVHLLGDFLTTGGLPIFWPVNPKAPKAWANTPLLGRLWSQGGYFAFPILGNAGSWREWLLNIPLWLYAFYGIGVSVLTLLPFVDFL